MAIAGGVVGGVEVGEGGVGGHGDGVVFVPLDEVGLLEVGVQFELVDGGLDGRLGDELVELMRGEVGDADVAHFACREQLFHTKPGLFG